MKKIIVSVIASILLTAGFVSASEQLISGNLSTTEQVSNAEPAVYPATPCIPDPDDNK